MLSISTRPAGIFTGLGHQLAFGPALGAGLTNASVDLRAGIRVGLAGVGHAGTSVKMCARRRRPFVFVAAIEPDHSISLDFAEGPARLIGWT
jgi:hypothetical protein